MGSNLSQFGALRNRTFLTFCKPPNLKLDAHKMSSPEVLNLKFLVIDFSNRLKLLVLIFLLLLLLLTLHLFLSLNFFKGVLNLH